MSKEKKENPIWMPYEEYLLHKQMMEKMDKEAKLRMGYFFWNNYSDEGYEEYRKKFPKEL